MKLSSIQQRAYDKLTEKHQSAYSLREGLSTLRSLVSKGLAESSSSSLGTMFSPRTAICFRKKRENEKGELVGLKW